MTDIMMTLKACRVNSNMKIREVADSIGKTERTIKNWECGRSIPNGLDLKSLSKLYNVPVDHIFLGDNIALSEYYQKTGKRES
ncbi:helix-turn-helix domain-containing protein [Breznakia pachnodae]|uniref:Transcriptional regulator with XRE-family HTH domain n=1 Tax=Breznakia pachnodae TaxID=265178 RepID=A0ABU0E551_9FIRM|nr:helix-turn-helix transcriptional regulator [Breznakia pachnodae]MDQ0361946.1 transcriptional regulator with XRE-family HTH domain [Breznakia pachnodae]